MLARIAERAMVARGFLPYPPPQALAEAQAQSPAQSAGSARDLSAFPWTSIDNPESRDLDQIEAVESVSGGTKLYVGIADVEHCVAAASANDDFSAHNTTSVYTDVRNFPMLPERFSYDLTSLVAGQKRLAVVIETVISPDGQVKSWSVYTALVENKAKLDYPSVSSWLDGKSPAPSGLAQNAQLQKQVELQDAVAKTLAEARKKMGSLDIDTEETRISIDERGQLSELSARRQDRAGAIIEELMIASNTALARELDSRGQTSIRRVVKEPKNWPRIVSYAAGLGCVLPAKPSSIELSKFINTMRARQPEKFSELSLCLVKLIGRGEYAVHQPGEAEIGHFGLAVDAYTHGTAPNRRYIDLVNQRIVKKTHAYSLSELSGIAAHCSEAETSAKKVERQVHKAAGALLLKSRVGQMFNGVVTGVGPKGTFARILELPVEGMVVAGGKGLQVGDNVRLKLRDVQAEKGYIDFQAA
jgi:exoribonuclease-2